jgi:hypothetical protein
MPQLTHHRILSDAGCNAEAPNIMEPLHHKVWHHPVKMNRLAPIRGDVEAGGHRRPKTTTAHRPG